MSGGPRPYADAAPPWRARRRWGKRASSRSACPPRGVATARAVRPERRRPRAYAASDSPLGCQSFNAAPPWARLHRAGAISCAFAGRVFMPSSSLMRDARRSGPTAATAKWMQPMFTAEIAFEKRGSWGEHVRRIAEAVSRRVPPAIKPADGRWSGSCVWRYGRYRLSSRPGHGSTLIR